ncbi:topless-related protein 4-like [Daucus carota subsp. sativus]|uniref:topless-related protein 4-like n=1 Tax=Daucus carota subsp. sativus TaxID=79200 RepID=UPI0007EEFF4C|nr:PREDICTED: topless-related protein 4-like [Daucus carota subsp. sativus]
MGGIELPTDESGLYPVSCLVSCRHGYVDRNRRVGVTQLSNEESASKLVIPEELIGGAAYSCDGQSIDACFLNRHIVFLDSASLTIKFVINPSAYLPFNQSRVMYASPLAANPTKHNQFALGLSDGGLLVIEEEDIGIAL